MFTVLEVKTEEFLKLKNMQTHILLPLRVMTSSHVTQPLKNSILHLWEDKSGKGKSLLNIIMKIGLTLQTP